MKETMANLSISTGYTLFTDPSAQDCFDAFRQWADALAPLTAQQEGELGAKYFELRMSDPEVDNYSSNSGNPVAAWVDATLFKTSPALHRDFFAGDKNWIGNMVPNVQKWLGAWPQLADELADVNNPALFDQARAQLKVRNRAIELEQIPGGTFTTPSTSDGRHRTMALYFLGAPYMPVMLHL